MNRLKLILLFFFLAFAVEANSQDRQIKEKLSNVIAEYGQAEIAVPFSSRTYLDNLSRRFSVWSVNDKKAFITLSPLDLEKFLELNQPFEIVENKGLEGIVSASGVDVAMEWDTYPTYPQYDSIMRKFASNYPSLCRLDTIGKSGYGKLIMALKISDNVTQNENEPEVFYTSTMHGDETGGFVLMLHLIDYLLKNYAAVPAVRELVDNLEIWINPLSNPDGTYRTGNTITIPTRFNSGGFDLNRNFPDPLDTSIEVPKENQDMIRFMRAHNFVLSANFHAGAEVVNYPWDRYLSRFHADDAWFNSISRAYADTVHKYSTPVYMDFMDNGVTRGAVWYTVYGGRQDFVTWELQGREVTIELDDIKTTPAAQLGLLWLYNRSSLIGYLGNALYGIHGQVRDSVSLKPLKAKVFIAGHDKDSSHVYSDTLYGAFVRMLAPGSYDITFSAAGYKTKTVKNVNVFKNRNTGLVVDLETDPTGTETHYNKPVEIYPNPAAGFVSIVLPEDYFGYLTADIHTVTGVSIQKYRLYRQADEDLKIDISLLKNGTYILVISSENNTIRTSLKFVVVK